VRRPRIALILAGGAARGAYEVGVVQHILEEVSRDLGRPVRFNIYCGTSVGAINACALAAFAEMPGAAQAARLRAQWERLRVGHVVRVDTREVFGVVRSLFGRNRQGDRGGVLDPTGLERIVETAIPWSRIGENIRAGLLDAVTISTTHVATGKTTVFVEREGPLPDWGRDPTVEVRAAQLGAVHALASAALPFVFPCVPIDGQFHCDGGLRQNVPLSPARRLGADGMIVISPRYADVDDADPANETAYPSPFFLLGKVLNALLLDRIDADIDRLQRMTAVLDAGIAVYGPQFLDEVNRHLRPGSRERSLRPIRAVLIRASQNIAALASEFVRTPAFGSRAGGVVGALLRRLGEGSGESDLLSYLLFDGEFARLLMELGRKDARARHAELLQFFEKFAEATTVQAVGS
jgi:NTE family protein